MPFRTPSNFMPAAGRVPPRGVTEPSVWFCVRERKLLVLGQGELPFGASLAEIGVEAHADYVLGHLDGRMCRVALLTTDSALPEGSALSDLRGLLGTLSRENASIAGRAVQIAEWERAHRYCGVCGTATVLSDGGRAKRCPECGHESFPRLSPAVIVAVERGEEILLARGPHFPPDIHACLAGFVDPGESAEEAVAREVFEEVGIRVDNIRYFGSQPWPFPHSLMLGFQADYVSGELRLDPTEIVSAEFYRADAMPKMFSGQVSIGQWLVRDFLRRMSDR